ncbi:hypothetical protein GGS23DRAFT_293156 [Durotheca rogersii]|uniref:uncharacterized protein n=1 Tax=Durotheca rogersii TaxID=419775 RepID=UPI00221FEA58|nr:uncharacterized protein GGS23DRAFT_293156 [Durotheca rogersii]KAI5866874.1 hypothetical protein GGS23DRAFT_293156 [Durotheca rogersii]
MPGSRYYTEPKDSLQQKTKKKGDGDPKGGHITIIHECSPPPLPPSLYTSDRGPNERDKKKTGTSRVGTNSGSPSRRSLARKYLPDRETKPPLRSQPSPHRRRRLRRRIGLHIVRGLVGRYADGQIDRPRRVVSKDRADWVRPGASTDAAESAPQLHSGEPLPTLPTYVQASYAAASRHHHHHHQQLRSASRAGGGRSGLDSFADLEPDAFAASCRIPQQQRRNARKRGGRERGRDGGRGHT